jgi:hypothetical protein
MASRYIDPRFLDLSGNHLLPLYPMRKNSLYPLDKSENSWLYRDSKNSDSSVVEPVASRYTDWATAAHDDGQFLLLCSV